MDRLIKSAAWVFSWIAALASTSPAIAATFNATATATATSVAAPAPDSDAVTLALHFVEYSDHGRPVLDEAAAQRLTAQLNELYAPCRIGFRIEGWEAIDPAASGLRYHTARMDELDGIRARFTRRDQLLIVNTGAWNHVEMGAPNAWTAMPSETLLGAVIEAPVASFAGIVAHEIGHYLSLEHVDDRANLMNPIIYKRSRALEGSQCGAMREVARGPLHAALRPNA